MTKKKYYVVWKGHKTGIFTSWEECSAQVSGFSDAEYMAFESKSAAEKAFRSSFEDYKGKHIPNLSQEMLYAIGEFRTQRAIDGPEEIASRWPR